MPAGDGFGRRVRVAIRALDFLRAVRLGNFRCLTYSTSSATTCYGSTQRSKYPAENARKVLTDLGKLASKRYPTADLAAQALNIAVDKSITAYDACYVALAPNLSVPFVTSNDKLARALSGTKYQVHWLVDFAIPPVLPQSANGTDETPEKPPGISSSSSCR